MKHPSGSPKFHKKAYTRACSPSSNQSSLKSRHFGFYDWINLITLLVVLYLGIIALKELRTEYRMFVLVSIVFVLMRGTYNYLFNGIIRYSLDIFPIFIAAGFIMSRVQKKKKWGLALYLIVAGVLQVILVAIFASWGWVS